MIIWGSKKQTSLFNTQPAGQPAERGEYENSIFLFTTILARGSLLRPVPFMEGSMPVNDIKILVPGSGFVTMAKFRTDFLRPPIIPDRRSDLFGRCSWCGAFEIAGVCQTCGHQAVCGSCKKTRRPDGSWKRSPIGTGEKVSHGHCPECMWIMYPDIALRIAQEKYKNHASN